MAGLSLLWIISAVYNYRRALRLLFNYIKQDEVLRLKVENVLSLAMRAEASEALMTHKNAYPALNQLMESYSTNEQETLHNLKKLYFKLGFFYNIPHISE